MTRYGNNYRYWKVWDLEMIRISGIPEAAADRVKVTVAETGKDLWLPRRLADFGPGRVYVPAWLYAKLRPYLTGEVQRCPV